MIDFRRTITAAALFVMAAGALHAQAQPAVINGRVTSEQGQPLLGANVFITELNISVGTNEAGRYTINVPAARVSGQTVVLRVRSIGFAPISRNVTLTSGSTQNVDFQLRVDPTRLTEVVVTGVSAATEQIKVPFAVARVDSAQMPVTGGNALQQLQGKVPGATIIGGSGRPGAAPTVMLRGPTSLNATNRDQGPLYIVDGVLMQGNLPDLSPADIESFEVVKGAAAASLYGSRAGAGVISITTRSGKNAAEGVKFGFRSEFGFNDIEREVPLAQRHYLAMEPTGQFFCTTDFAGGSPCGRVVDMETERLRVNESGLDHSLPSQAFRNDVGIARAANYQQLTGLYQTWSYPKVYDPIGAVTTPSQFVTSDLDVRGKLGATGFFASVGTSRQQGAVRFLEGYRRNSARLNLDHQFSDALQLSATSYYSKSFDDGGRQDQNTTTGWFQLTRTPAYVDLLKRDSQGRLYIRSNVLNQGTQNANPLYGVENDKLTIERGRFLGGGSLRYFALPWLEFDANAGYDRSDYNTFRMNERGFRSTNASPGTAAGFIAERGGDAESYNMGVGALARGELLPDLHTTWGARYLFESQRQRNANWGGSNIAVPGVTSSDAIIEGFAIGSNRQVIRRAGVLGTANLDYKDRYILDFSVRRDGSSLFGSDNRWATFGRAAGAWVASAEPWWPASNAISTAKLRTSYGTSGNGPSFAAQYETFTIGTGGTLNPNTLGNRNLKPEINRELESGIDLEFFDRYGLSLTYANAVIDDQIQLIRPPTASGFQFQWQNAGAIENKTWEAALTVPLLTRQNLQWTSRVLYDRTRSTVKRLDVPPYTVTVTLGNPYTIFQVKEGERIGTFYGVDFVRSCDQLPANFQSQCGGTGAQFQKNDQGYVVWTGGRSQTEGITSNLWTAQLGADVAPWGVAANWGMPLVRRDDATSGALQLPLGNGMADYHLSWSHNVNYKRLGAFVLLDGYYGRDVWNIGYHWSLGDFMTAEQDQSGRSVEDAKPIGYYWRRGAGGPGGSGGVGGFYDVLGPNRFSVEDGSFTKLRELSVNYRVGSVAGIGNWTVGVIGSNLYTWTKFRGFDPEVGVQANNGVPGANIVGDQFNSAAITAIAGYRYPNPRRFTLQLSSSF